MTYLNKFLPKNFKVKIFKQKLRHQVVEAEALRVKVEAIQKLPLPHIWEKLQKNGDL